MLADTGTFCAQDKANSPSWYTIVFPRNKTTNILPQGNCFDFIIKILSLFD